MNTSDDSDENIFDASARLASGCETTSSLIQCTEDESCCELLQVASSDNGKACYAYSPLESTMQPQNETTVPPTYIDSNCKCDSQSTDLQISTVQPASELVECQSSMNIESLVTVHSDGTDQTTDSLERTNCAVKSNSCLTDATEVIGSSHAVQPTGSHVSVNSNELDDELLAELENEFSCITAERSYSVTSDYDDKNRPLSAQTDHLSTDNLTLAIDSLQRRQQALECRLQSTLEAKKQLETENGRLECKLSASLEALEVARQDMESAKLQV